MGTKGRNTFSPVTFFYVDNQVTITATAEYYSCGLLYPSRLWGNLYRDRNHKSFIHFSVHLYKNNESKLREKVKKKKKLVDGTPSKKF